MIGKKKLERRLGVGGGRLWREGKVLERIRHVGNNDRYRGRIVDGRQYKR